MLIVVVATAPILATAASDDRLRVLRLRAHQANHPHRDVAGEFKLLNDFARHHGLTLSWSEAVQPAELQARLLRGEGDVVVADLPPGANHGGAMSPSVAMGSYRYQVIGSHALDAHDPTELAGLRVAVSLASPLWRYFVDLDRQQPGPELVVFPDDYDRDQLLAGIERGDYDAAVISRRSGHRSIDQGNNLKVLFTLSANNTAVWWFRREQADLRQRLNAYAQKYYAGLTTARPVFGDIEQIRQRHVLRVITRVDPQNYFLKHGRRAGFEYELVQQFTRMQNLSLEFLVADSDQQVLDWLRDGIGDIATTRLAERQVANDHELTQSRRYFHSASVIVNHARQRPLRHSTLRGKRVAVLRDSVQHHALAGLIAEGRDLTAVIVSPDTEISQLAQSIERGAIDAAIIDAHALAALNQKHPLIQAGASLPDSFPYAWTMRSANLELAAEVDRFLNHHYRKKTYNVLARRYFQQPQFAQFNRGELSPFDALVQRHAEDFEFDWRLIVAQMYQESKFDPDAISSAGALGLMQLLPSTARSVGVHNPLDPEAGIRGGVAYLDRLRRRFDQTLSPRERTWFALAAYNIGFHRIELARRHALNHGRDPNRWFGHVEYAMRDMVEDNGCRCGQTVVYVRGIRSLYTTYRQLEETLTADLFNTGSKPAI